MKRCVEVLLYDDRFILIIIIFGRAISVNDRRCGITASPGTVTTQTRGSRMRLPTSSQAMSQRKHYRAMPVASGRLIFGGAARAALEIKIGKRRDVSGTSGLESLQLRQRLWSQTKQEHTCWGDGYCVGCWLEGWHHRPP